VTTEQANEEFWNELCGSNLAQMLGITDRTMSSLERFDGAYLEYYPYLLTHVKLATLANRRIVEIGLGYGTLGQKIAEACANYLGLDLAEAPVRMMQHRLHLHGLAGSCVRGSALNLPFASESVDGVISIGCLHHTGNVARALDEAYRILTPGGRGVFMMYNQFSYRQWCRWPLGTFRALLRDMGLPLGEVVASEAQRHAYDSSASGQAAPETAFVSIRQLRHMLRRFSRVEIRKENTTDLLRVPRKHLLSSVGRLLGLDTYVQVQK